MLSLYELLKEVDDAKTRQAKILTLHKYSDKQLKAFLSYVFDPNIKWLVPEGAPPYTPSTEDANMLRGRIWQDFRILQHFTSVGPYPHMKPAKREELFIGLLQTIHPDDAKLLLYVKDNRALPFKSIDRALIKEAFDILEGKWGPESALPKKKEKAPVTAPLESLGDFGDVGTPVTVEANISQEEAEAAVKAFIEQNKPKKPAKGKMAKPAVPAKSPQEDLPAPTKKRGRPKKSDG